MWHVHTPDRVYVLDLDANTTWCVPGSSATTHATDAFSPLRDIGRCRVDEEASWSVHTADEDVDWRERHSIGEARTH